MDDKRRTAGNEEEIDLSGMINEYSQDNELRKKIEELKKQKEEEKRIYESRQQQPSQSSIFDSISETGTFKRPEAAKQGGVPDIRVDDTQLDKTRVGFDDDPAYDKTLVIMNNKSRASSADQTQAFDQDRTTVFHTENAYDYNDSDAEEEETEEELYEEDDDDNLLARIKEKKQRKEEAKRNSHQDDEDDDEEEDDPGKSAKMNKVITYVIIGIVGICIIAGAFFGVKYALSNFLGGSDDKEKTTDKSDTGTKDIDKNDNSETNKPTESDAEKNIQTNQAEAAQLQKQLDQYESQLKDVEKDLAAAIKDKAEAETELKSYSSLGDNASKLTGQANTVKPYADAFNKVKEYISSEDDEKKDQYTTAYNALQSALAGTDFKTYEELQEAANAANSTYNSKVQAAEQKKSTAESSISSLENRKTDLESKIADTTTKLNAYN